ncbi:MAG: DUF3084 domain-containing protein [Armatimonadota bacterium]|nr:DUF3084 domain-containing protein [Armatimonadota bacterium]MDR7444019.1 DUF3084 domain-containing protein [Armatimonadota bacterium]MDR7570921.1 DUF3084 domain-containing protein [Armatimonadota bacterium]MDR7615378.1 DUF3084 domain-containing protein [Armatimonadota bacterium]
MEIGYLFLPLLLLISGLIAYVGNVVGRRVGKQRLSLWGLRPRTTAHIVTVLTGMLIHLLTVGTVLGLSRDARTALFRLRETVSQLEGRAEELRREIARLEGGTIAVLSDQELAREVLDGRLSPSEVREAFFRLRQRAVEFATGQGAGPDANGNVIVPFEPGISWEAIERLIRRRRQEVVVRIVSTKNVLAGEPVPVAVQLVNNELVFRKGQVLGEGVVPPGPREQVRDVLLALVQVATQRAGPPGRSRILSAPQARVNGPPYVVVDGDSGRRITDQILRRGVPTRVRVVVLRDAFTEGPLWLGFELGRTPP